MIVPSAPTETRQVRQLSAMGRRASRFVASFIDPAGSEESQIVLAMGLRQRLSSEQLVSMEAHCNSLIEDPETLSSWNLMQDLGATRLQKLRFVAAPDLPNPLRPELPARQECIQQARSRNDKKNASRTMDAAVTALVPTAFLGGMVTLGVMLVSAGVSVAYPDVGPAATSDIDRVIAAGFDMMDMVGLGTAISITGSMYAWKRQGIANDVLEQKIKQVEPTAIASGYGVYFNTSLLVKRLGSIQTPARKLIEHLDPIDLRAFILGTEQSRRQILTESPPPLSAELSYLMASYPPGPLSIFKLVSAVVNLSESAVGSEKRLDTLIDKVFHRRRGSDEGQVYTSASVSP